MPSRATPAKFLLSIILEATQGREADVADAGEPKEDRMEHAGSDQDDEQEAGEGLGGGVDGGHQGVGPPAALEEGTGGGARKRGHKGEHGEEQPVQEGEGQKK